MIIITELKLDVLSVIHLGELADVYLFSYHELFHLWMKSGMPSMIKFENEYIKPGIQNQKIEFTLGNLMRHNTALME